MKTLLILIAIALAIAIADRASAAPADALRDAVMAPRAAAAQDAPAVTLSERQFLEESDAQAYALKRAGIARTSLEQRYDDDLSAALGFVCGLQPGVERSGAAAARGYDPNGRFLGAKLSLAFK